LIIDHFFFSEFPKVAFDNVARENVYPMLSLFSLVGVLLIVLFAKDYC